MNNLLKIISSPAVETWKLYRSDMMMRFCFPYFLVYLVCCVTVLPEYGNAAALITSITLGGIVALVDYLMNEGSKNNFYYAEINLSDIKKDPEKEYAVRLRMSNAKILPRIGDMITLSDYTNAVDAEVVNIKEDGEELLAPQEFLTATLQRGAKSLGPVEKHGITYQRVVIHQIYARPLPSTWREETWHIAR